MKNKHFTSAPASTPASFERVESFANPAVKLLRSLDQKKSRAESGLFLSEGLRHVREALAHGWRPQLMVCAEAAASRSAMAEVLVQAAGLGARVLLAPDRVMEKVAHRDNPQTLIGAFAQRLADFTTLEAAGGWGVLALHEVRDPGNLGTLLRTADAVGVAGVVLTGKCCDPFSVEAVRASMGSLFAMPLVQAEFAAFDAWRRRAGLRLRAASLNPRGLPEGQGRGPVAVLMGNEQSGLPPEIEAACDELVRLPMRAGPDSLNVASAGAVMLYDAWRERGHVGAA
jgi:TrmH family RNA methyltransferase